MTFQLNYGPSEIVKTLGELVEEHRETIDKMVVKWKRDWLKTPDAKEELEDNEGYDLIPDASWMFGLLLYGSAR